MEQAGGRRGGKDVVSLSRIVLVARDPYTWWPGGSRRGR